MESRDYKSFVFPLLAIAGMTVMADSFSIGELVRVPPVKFSLESVCLTRVVEELSDANERVIGKYFGVIREYGSHYRKLGEAGNGNSGDYTTRNKVGWGVQGNAGLAWGFIPHGDISVSGECSDASTKITRLYSDSHTNVSYQCNLDYREQEGFVEVTEDRHRLRLGKFKLVVRLAMCGTTANGRYRVGKPGAGVVLQGFGEDIIIPFPESFELGAERRVCELTRVLDDTSLMQRVLGKRDLSGIAVSISGSQLPIVDADGRNVLLEEASREYKCTSVEFSADIDDRGMLGRRAPWRVRTMFPASSGRRGEAVTMKDALEALAEHLAKDEDLPLKSFSFGADGSLTGLYKLELGKLRVRKDLEGKDVLQTLAVSVAGDFPRVWMLPIPADSLACELADCSSVGFVELNVKETAEELYGRGLIGSFTRDLPSTIATKKAFEALAEDLAKNGDSRVKDAIAAAKDNYAQLVKQQEEVDKRYLKIAGLTLRRIPGRKFAIGVTEVTQRQWMDVMQANPSKWDESENRPVEAVSREDIQAYFNKLNERPEVRNAHVHFRLPSLEEWSFACRAGSASSWGWVRDGEAGSCDDLAWYKGNSLGMTHPVGSKVPNLWGIHDMHGNVWEWLNDSRGGEFLIAGGSYAEGKDYCRADAVTSAPGNQRSSNVGFRLLATEY